ncbi:hypothetical protein TsFJ059_005955 [Trichoderma semiorbis]|uniref:Uncharacterized protein n=1 Tax=Trichoderma semiorbis TaxID=1491008 RepID=A0A9P8KN78_9HYPO|nr:hypothetical protein TsFJ059_005955 [Trichoderma semiorbis]
MDSTQLKSSPSDPSSWDFQGHRATTKTASRECSSGAERRNARTHARNNANARPWVLVLVLFLVLGLEVLDIRAPSQPANERLPRPSKLSTFTHASGTANRTSYGDWLQLNFGLHRFALKSVSWLRRTRHLDLKPLRRRRRQETLFGKWLRHICCFVLGWATDECCAQESVLGRAEQMHACFVLSILLTTSESKSTLAQCYGVDQASRGREAIAVDDVVAILAPPHHLAPPSAAKSLTFILSPVHGPSCRHANLVRVLATQRPIRNLCPQGLSCLSHPWM